MMLPLPPPPPLQAQIENRDAAARATHGVTRTRFSVILFSLTAIRRRGQEARNTVSRKHGTKRAQENYVSEKLRSTAAVSHEAGCDRYFGAFPPSRAHRLRNPIPTIDRFRHGVSTSIPAKMPARPLAGRRRRAPRRPCGRVAATFLRRRLRYREIYPRATIGKATHPRGSRTACRRRSAAGIRRIRLRQWISPRSPAARRAPHHEIP